MRAAADASSLAASRLAPAAASLASSRVAAVASPLAAGAASWTRWRRALRLLLPGWFTVDVLAPFVVTRLVLALVGLVTVAFVPRFGGTENAWLSTEPWLNIWSIWDTRWYLSIARDGYSYVAGQESNAAFAPGLPLLMHLGAQLFGRSDDDAYLLVGFVASNVALLVALGYLWALVRREFDRSTAARSVVYLLVFPSSFFLSAVYPHALFLACAIASVYYGRQGRWWLAGVLGCAAGLTRLQAAALVLPLAFEYLRQRGVFAWVRLALRGAASTPHLAGRGRAWRALERAMALAQSPFRATAMVLRTPPPSTASSARHQASRLAAPGLRPDVLALALVPLGFVAFAAYLGVQSGEPLAAFRAGAAWHRQLMWPWQVLGPFVMDPLTAHGALGTPGDFLVALLLLVGAAASWRTLPSNLALMATTFVVIVISSGTLVSSQRYALEAFPIFITLARLGGRRRWIHHGYLAIACLNALRLMSQYALGDWIA